MGEKKDQKAREEQEAKERKQKEQEEKERAELEIKEKKRLAKEQREKDEKLKKEQRKAKEIEEKERKLQEKLEKERNEREQKERKRKEKEAREQEQKMLKEKKEAEDRELKDRKAKEKNDPIQKAQNDSEDELGIQNYDSTEAPSMIQKEKQFDESHKEISHDLKSPNLIEKFEYEPTKEVVSGSDSYLMAEESRTKNPFESESDMIEDGYENKENELKTISERDEKSTQYDEKSYTTPHETDKTDFVTVDDTLVSNEDTYNGKESELRLQQTDHTMDSVSFSSLPSDSQILEGHSKSNLLDDHGFQEKIGECEETDNSLGSRVEPTDNLNENKKELALT